MPYNEETADFRKLEYIEHKDFIDARDSFFAAQPKNKSVTFLNYCFAIINQRNLGTLTIRESAYAIAGCSEQSIEESLDMGSIINDAVRLKRHPSNYKEDHELGWDELVKQISKLRKKL